MHGNAMMDFRGYYDVFQELEDFIRREPQLAEFVDAAAELTEQARLVTEGARSVPPLSAKSSAVIPTRELAVAILQIMSKLPSIPAGASDETKTLVGYLLGNLAEAVTAAIYKRFPDTVSR